jgi:hypothetical protein
MDEASSGDVERHGSAGLIAAALPEAGGDAVVRTGLDSHAAAVRAGDDPPGVFRSEEADQGVS